MFEGPSQSQFLLQAHFHSKMLKIKNLRLISEKFPNDLSEMLTFLVFYAPLS